MRISGKKSISSFLTVVLAVTWYSLPLAIIGVLAGMIGIAVSSQAPIGDFHLNAQSLRLTFTGTRIANPRIVSVGTLGLVLIGLVIAELVVFRLRKILASIREGEPFAVRNSRHIRTIGITVLAGSILNAIGSLIVGYLAASAIHLPGVDLSPRAGSPMSGIFLGLVILVLAEVFRRGAELQEDHDLTV